MFLRSAFYLLQTAGIIFSRYNTNMDAMAIVRNYMHASSAHELQNIFNHLLDDKIDYTAGSGQRFVGKSEVESMMRPFFAKFGPSLRWETVDMFPVVPPSFTSTDSSSTSSSSTSSPSQLPPAVTVQLSNPRSATIEVVFRRHWEDAQTGAQVADGREWITVGADNKITHTFVVLKQ